MAHGVDLLMGGAASGRTPNAARRDAAPPTAAHPITTSPMGGAASGRAPDPAQQDAAPPDARRDAAPPIATHPIVPSPRAPQFLSQEKVIERTCHHLPHWEQDGTTCFVTFRLADSLPKEKLAQLREERDVWLAAHPEFVRWRDSARIDTLMGGAASGRAPISARRDASPPIARQDAAPPVARRDAAPPAPQVIRLLSEEYSRLFEERVQNWLDAGYGECILQPETNRNLVESALLHFDGDRYFLHAFVVMPNHVHVLFTPDTGWSVSTILQSWKSFTAKRINALRGRTGTVWQKESWDRFIRNPRHFSRTVDYIVNNPGSMNIPVYVANSARQDAAPPAPLGGAASGRAQPNAARQDAAPPAPVGSAASGRAQPNAARQDAAPSNPCPL